MRHASPERGGGREADEGGLEEREAKRSLPQLASAVPTSVFRGNPEIDRRFCTIIHQMREIRKEIRKRRHTWRMGKNVL